METEMISMNVNFIKDKERVNNIDKAVEILKRAGLIIYPTETFYGIGADALNPDAVRKIFKIKGRTERKPLPLIISDIRMLDLLEVEINKKSALLIESFWPGPLTILFRVRRELPDGVVSGDKKVGIRISSNPIAREIVHLLDSPVTATSANLSGDNNPENISDISEKLLKSVDAVIDAGKLQGGLASTIVDPTVSPIRIIREGAISSTKIFSVVER